MSTTLEFSDEAGPFAQAAGPFLAAGPVLSTVVSTVLEMEGDGRGRDRAVREGYPYWFVIARDDTGEVAGVAMRTASFEPHPAYVLTLPDEAAVRLARTLHERGEALEGVNGSLPAARIVAEETARLTDGAVSVSMPTRLYEVRDVIEPRRPEGRLRPATRDDADLVVEWFDAFDLDAAAQAGRTPSALDHPIVDRPEIRQRIDEGGVWLWETPAGRPVHLTCVRPPAYGVSRVGPVYTPREHRGRGYAGAAVAEVSRRILASGHRACLFTDQANPVSNRLYASLGYRPVVDMANHVVGPSRR
ncbi:GCN5-related N-acetyltransferase [Nostocoides japonicum T1-X7]|uniref:GCN5-related N-acetyltransferase n=1 Tax=Nostocoides japonicum T1-X7 TaxID=1194083 RepID=A0A077LUI5_9MICO|nr:GNAT family N-acetyltransferase [Tetrasphaera japonica]CCH77503.1 GCN5-related N-acetyltransferase [Tetrasphaera japonica T1-X7]